MSSPQWRAAKAYTDILYHKAEGMARITINRPEIRNAFRPLTVAEMHDALLDAREDQSIGVVFLTGAGPAKASTATTTSVAPNSVSSPSSTASTSGSAQ